MLPRSWSRKWQEKRGKSGELKRELLFVGKLFHVGTVCFSRRQFSSCTWTDMLEVASKQVTNEKRLNTFPILFLSKTMQLYERGRYPMNYLQLTKRKGLFVTIPFLGLPRVCGVMSCMTSTPSQRKKNCFSATDEQGMAVQSRISLTKDEWTTIFVHMRLVHLKDARRA